MRVTWTSELSRFGSGVRLHEESAISAGGAICARCHVSARCAVRYNSNNLTEEPHELHV